MELGLERTEKFVEWCGVEGNVMVYRDKIE